MLCSIVYSTLKYIHVVNGITEASMQDAIERVKALPHYETKGEVLLPALYFMFRISIFHTNKQVGND